MTTTTNLPPRAGIVQRYGPLTGIVIAIAVVATLVTVYGQEEAGAPTTRTGDAAGAPAPGDMPVTYEQAKAQGRQNTITWDDSCDPATGRVELPTIYAFPCVPRFTGDNGGATAPGVTADKISVVWYQLPQVGDVMAALAGNIDPPEATRETAPKFVELLSSMAETYGRKVELVFFQGKAAADDALAARAEAQEIIDKYKPFAVIQGPALTPAYAEELAAQGVLCLSCGGSLADQAYQDNAPHLWGAAASPEQWLTIVSEYLGDRLAGKPAKWAGDPGLRSATRKFGTVNFEQDPPQFSALSQTGEACKSVTGWSPAVRETYLATDMVQRAPTIIAKLKAEKVTTVMFMGDPIMPTVLTPEATKQGYFPEWFVTGTALTDTNVFGRRFDQRQWEHAFGLSQLSVSIPREQMDGWRLHQWYFGTPPKAEKTSAVMWPPVFQLFNGIHMAGPKLSVETFKQGLFNLPAAGGGPTSPRVSYGDDKVFQKLDPDSCEGQPIIDYLGTDDMVEVWWDPTVPGPDEQNNTDKTGKYRFVNNGRRYMPGQLPETEPDVFKVEGSVTEYTVRPDVDRAPDYPPPPR